MKTITIDRIEYNLVPVVKEEPKFKVGQWVRHPESQSIYQINSLNIVHGTEHFELWEPKVGEWCWYGFELIEVIDTTNPLKICRQQSDSYEEVSGTMLEPFIGNLPSFIKEKR